MTMPLADTRRLPSLSTPSFLPNTPPQKTCNTPFKTQNAVLINHVDVRETHVASAILQVAQQTDVGWPLELIEPDGSVIEVYMQPGQMLLYEGSRVPHGRPRRSEGDAFANVFVHYKPRAWNYDEDVAREMAEEVVKRVQRGRQDET